MLPHARKQEMRTKFAAEKERRSLKRRPYILAEAIWGGDVQSEICSRDYLQGICEAVYITFLMRLRWVCFELISSDCVVDSMRVRFGLLLGQVRRDCRGLSLLGSVGCLKMDTSSGAKAIRSERLAPITSTRRLRRSNSRKTSIKIVRECLRRRLSMLTHEAVYLYLYIHKLYFHACNNRNPHPKVSTCVSRRVAIGDILSISPYFVPYSHSCVENNRRTHPRNYS